VALFCGIDWAEAHHDVAVVDTDGLLVAKRRILHSAEGFGQLQQLLADAGDSDQAPIPVAIETPRGLLVAALRASGRPVYAINPLAVARYRDRHAMAGAKSDHHDAVVLANILRTDAHRHRVMAADSELARAVSVLARAAQDAIWRRTRAVQNLREVLREYYPGFLQAFSASSQTNLATAEARAVLALAPTPQRGAKVTRPRITAALRRAGRQRLLAATADRIYTALRQPQLQHPPLVEQALGQQALALLATLNAECVNADQLGDAAIEAFRSHPDHAIMTSFPGLGESTAARLFAEIGDDRTRFADARGLKAFAGAAPVTRASGRSLSVTHRRVKNNRMAAVGFVWSFATIAQHGPDREHYNQRRAHGDRHAAALRHLFNRHLGCLHHCLHSRQLYDEHKAFPTHRPPQSDAA
jgi:transposase